MTGVEEGLFKGLLEGDEPLGVLLDLVGSGDDGAMERSLLCGGVSN